MMMKQPTAIFRWYEKKTVSTPMILNKHCDKHTVEWFLKIITKRKRRKSNELQPIDVNITHVILLVLYIVIDLVSTWFIFHPNWLINPIAKQPQQQPHRHTNIMFKNGNDLQVSRSLSIGNGVLCFQHNRSTFQSLIWHR